MIELKRPIPITDHIAVFPSELKVMTRREILIRANRKSVLWGNDLPRKKAARLTMRKTLYIKAMCIPLVYQITRNAAEGIANIRKYFNPFFEKSASETAPRNLPIISPPQ